ncbi:MAG TPA: bifunctional precorrin-2 dehydrogenase/sirohydrochlorin ferrochelatase [Gemmatimonadaceae bacterium]|nr:bifunctional precorrin-2 dehydrogenase/sirohydrochlorin ferrochelatase [Gemmatimonadaceae bacterium]
MSGVPILVDGAGLRVLIVGGGPVAARKLAAFREAGARVRLVSPEATAEIRALSDAGEVAWLARRYQPSDLGDAQLVVAATADRAVNAKVAADARAVYRLVNVADVPDDGTFTMMAVHRSGSLVVGVSAGGVPGAAARIRDAIARRFDGRYARALDRLATVRRTWLGSGEGARWRDFSRGVMGGEFCRTVEEGGIDEKVTSWQ